jgi:hypothetical protein
LVTVRTVDFWVFGSRLRTLSPTFNDEIATAAPLASTTFVPGVKE